MIKENLIEKMMKRRSLGKVITSSVKTKNSDLEHMALLSPTVQ